MGQPQTNLYLVGFMGTGKTTIGKAVAARLDFDFLDSDAEIEKRAGKPIAEIFSGEGEAVFRQYEREFIESGHPVSGQVVACGGGLVVPDGMLERVKRLGVVICLSASAESILQRTRSNTARPLLNVPDPEARIRSMLAEREPIYRRAGTVLLTDGRGLPELVQNVMRIYRREALERDRAAG